MVMASPSVGADMPYLTPEYETTIENLFIVGELGGLALIKNAVNQGRALHRHHHAEDSDACRAEIFNGLYDVLIVGAGPAGISASLRAIENKLSYITIERDEVGGTVAKFPRQKVVTTTPLEFPTYGKLKKTELSKEHLLAFWDMVLNRAEFNVCADAKVDDIKKACGWHLHGHDCDSAIPGAHRVLAIGRAGIPRKLGVKGEHLPKGDVPPDRSGSLSETSESWLWAAATARSRRPWAWRSRPATRSHSHIGRHDFIRIKERNAQRIEECMRAGKIDVIFNSTPVEFTEDTVVLKIGGSCEPFPTILSGSLREARLPTTFSGKLALDSELPAASDLHPQSGDRNESDLFCSVALVWHFFLPTRRSQSRF